MNLKLLLLATSLMGISLVTRANNSNPGTGEDCKKTDIAGGVFHSETKTPLSNVSVTAYSSQKKEKVAVTDKCGNYCFTELKPGIYKLVFEKTGFKKVVREKVMVKPEEGFQLSITMDNDDEFQILPSQLFNF